MLNITDIRVKTINNNSRLKAIASITIDECFVIHEIRIINGDKGLFIAMPSKKDLDDTYRDICHPLNTDVRQYIKESIINKYEEVKMAEEI